LVGRRARSKCCVSCKSIPEPGPEDAIAKTIAALVCTSDAHTVGGAIGALYQSKRPPTAADKRLAEKYFKSFETLSEPAFESYYYRANPDFWEWLRGLIGRSIPKPDQKPLPG